MSDPIPEKLPAAQPVNSNLTPSGSTTGAAGGPSALTLSAVLLAIWNHGFAILGLIGVILGVLIAAGDVFSLQTVKYLVLGLALVNAIVAYLKKILPNQPPG